MSPDEIESMRARLAELPDPDMDDPDNPEWTEEDFERAYHFDPPKRASDLTAEDFEKIREHAARYDARVTIELPLDPDVVDAFKSGGAGWQGRMNAVLREAMPTPLKRTA